jgi:hypothetical protein
MRSALFLAAAFGIDDAVPSSAVGAAAADRAALWAQGAHASSQLDTRVKAAIARTPADGTPDGRLAAAVARLTDLFGAGFRVLPTLRLVTPPPAGELDPSFPDSLLLQSGSRTAAVTWIERAARVRPGVARLADVLSYGELLGTDGLTFAVDQLPRAAGDRWAGLPYDPTKPPSGRISIVAHVVGRLDPSKPVAGLLFDAWSETVPAPTEEPALALHADTPDASAPAAVLVAVPPDLAGRWNETLLAATVHQTADLARLRLVDADALTGLGQFLPALYLSLDLRGQAISTDFTSASGVRLS